MPAAIPLIVAGSTIAGNVAKGRAEGRKAEANVNLEADRNATDRYQAEQNARSQSISDDLSQRSYADTANDRSYQNALRAALLGGVQDYSINAPAEVQALRQGSTGGLRPSAIAGREGISQLALEQAMNELMNPLQPGGITDPASAADPSSRAMPRQRAKNERFGDPEAMSADPGMSSAGAAAQRQGRYLPSIQVGQAPGATPMPTPGMLDKILGGIGTVGGIAGGVMNAMPNSGGAATSSGGGITVPGNPGDIMRGAGVRF